MADFSRPAREWPIPPMDHGSGHKGTAFTWPMGRLILQRIAEGEALKVITAEPRMPAYCTVFRWMQVVPEFGWAVAQVRAALAQEKLAAREAQRQLKGPRRRPGGRRCMWTPQIGAQICHAIEDGASLSEVVVMPGMPGFKTIYRWLERHPDFRASFVEACASRNGDLRLLAEETVYEVFALGIPEANRRIRALEGRAGRLTPKLYREPPVG
jgi:hypothetical protein